MRLLSRLLNRNLRSIIILSMVVFVAVILLLPYSIRITPFYSTAYADDIRCEGGSTCDGTEENDDMKADADNNSIRGLGSHDKLEGGDGSDHMTGGDGDDKLSGGNGNDVLEGQDDDDKLSGGNGNDQLIGGSGADDFKCGPGDDIIEDFDEADGDTTTADCEGFEQEV